MRPTMRHHIIECRVAIQAKDTYVREFSEFLTDSLYLLKNSSESYYYLHIIRKILDNSQNLLVLTNLHDSYILSIPTSVKIKLFHKDTFCPTYKIDLRFTNSSMY